MSDPESPQVRDATPPFDNPRRADVILRSSDLVDFHVYKLILSLASPVFETMFTLPATSSSDTMMADDDDHRHGLSVVKLMEDSCTLEALLQACYPTTGPHLNSIDSVLHILGVAEKYEITACHELARVVIASLAEDQPIRAYAVACRYGFKDVAVRAARACLTMTFDSIVRTNCPELTTVTGSQYQNLLQYHRDCGQKVSQLTSTLDWIKDDDCDGLVPASNSGCRCLSRSPGKCRYGPPYVWGYLARAGAALREHPMASVVFQASVFTAPEYVHCGYAKCHGDKTKAMGNFVRLLSVAVNTAIVQVRVSPTIGLIAG